MAKVLSAPTAHPASSPLPFSPVRVKEMPPDYVPFPGPPVALTWRWKAVKKEVDGSVHLQLWENKTSEPPETARLVATVDWIKAGLYYSLSRMVEAAEGPEGENVTVLPPNCLELSMVTCYRIAPGTATSTLAPVLTDDLSPSDAALSEKLKFVYGADGLVNRHFANAVFDNMGIVGANLDGAVFDRCSFINSVLYMTSMRSCKLEQSKMCDSNLSECDLRGANLKFAGLERTVLNGTKLLGANCSGAYFEGAKSVENVASWDPLRWRVTIRHRPVEKGRLRGERGKDCYLEDDHDDSGDATDGEQLTLKAALRRQASVTSAKGREHANMFVKELVSRKNMDVRATYNALLDSPFELSALSDAFRANIQQLSSAAGGESGGNASDEHCKTMLVDFQLRLAHRQERIFHEKLYARTINHVERTDAWSKLRIFFEHANRDIQDLRREKSEINDVMTQLQNLLLPFLSETWVDQLDQWKGLNNMQSELSSQRAKAVLRCVFEDKEVLRALGMGVQMMQIRGAPPGGLLLQLKQTLGGNIKKYYFTYRRALEDELHCIEFIEAQKRWVTTLIGSMFVAVMIGLANLLANAALNKFCSLGASDFCPARNE